MKLFRYIYSALFIVAVAVAVIIDVPLWVKIVIIVWSAIPLAVNEYQLAKNTKAFAEQEMHSTNATPDQVLHAYKERS